MLGPVALSLAAAVIPTLIYIYLIWWCDHYEREPGWLLAIAFTWGAAPAILLSVAAELLLQRPFAPFALGLAGNLFQVGLLSPVVEEVAKGLGLLGLYLFFYSEIDDVLDGIVYGALVGAGFAMTENFFYFLSTTMQSSTDGLLAVTFLRTVVFGLNHSFYTAIIGAFVGYATQGTRRDMRWEVPLIGLALAILAHALHNISTSLAAYHPATLILSALLNWGGLLILVGVIVLALQQEREWIRIHLADEVPATLSLQQYESAQKSAYRWGWWAALLDGKPARRARLEASLHSATIDLAFRKRRLAQLGDDARPALEGDIDRLRAKIMDLCRALSEAPA